MAPIEVTFCPKSFILVWFVTMKCQCVNSIVYKSTTGVYTCFGRILKIIRASKTTFDLITYL